MGRASRIRILVGCCLVGLLGFGADAPAFTFGPLVSQTGSQRTVFDWPSQHCETWDIPDQPPRAFKDDHGNVQLIASHAAVRREIGPDLNSVRHECAVVYMSHTDPDPAHFDDLMWISAPYTFDGKTIYALAHTEYRGFLHNNCPIGPDGSFSETAKCWYNAITFMRSTDSGANYTHAAAPDDLVASAPDTYVAGTGPDGVFTPSNIVYRDGYFYMLARATKTPGGEEGTCVWRTNTLSDPKSWRAWDGNGFGLRNIDPYIEPASPRSAHVCAFVSRDEIEGMTESLTWSSYYGKYMLVGGASPFGQPPGFYFSLSDDLIHWTPRRLLMQANVPWLANCGAPDPVRDPSVLDPASTSRNFETVGRTANLYFTQLHVTGSPCYWPEHRDLEAIPIRFSGSPPAASFAAFPNPVIVGQTVALDASASRDPNGSITKYEWDLDGDGVFERSSGGNPVLSTSFSKVPSGNVGLRVTDSEGLADDYYGPVTVNAGLTVQPSGSTLVPVASASFANLGDPLSPARSVSKKAKKRGCRVPRVRGLKVVEAKRRLRRAGCRYRTLGQGRIVSTSPRSGTRTRKTVLVRARGRGRS